MSSYQSNLSVAPAHIATLRHRRIGQAVPQPQAEASGASASVPEPTYADFIGGPVDTRTTFAVQLDRVS